MKNLQEIFNKAIDLGYYQGYRGKIYMCFALTDMRDDCVISAWECFRARRKIKQYLYEIDNAKSGYSYACTLELSLLRRGLPHEDKDLLAIYKDWKNRPRVTTGADVKFLQFFAIPS